MVHDTVQTNAQAVTIIYYNVTKLVTLGHHLLGVNAEHFTIMTLSESKDNPYLAPHPAQRVAFPPSSTAAAAAKEPLFGFLARKVKGPQVRTAMVRS